VLADQWHTFREIAGYFERMVTSTMCADPPSQLWGSAATLRLAPRALSKAKTRSPAAAARALISSVFDILVERIPAS
jgi:hypothetical protein